MVWIDYRVIESSADDSSYDDDNYEEEDGDLDGYDATTNLFHRD
jgi:hypothetical protein